MLTFHELFICCFEMNEEESEGNIPKCDGTEVNIWEC